MINNSLTLLLDAAANGDTLSVIQLIRDGVDVNCVNDKGWSPLVMAAFNQHLDNIKLLIDSGANVNHQSVNGTTVFMYAKTKVLNTEDYSILDYLLNKGAKINLRDFTKKWTVLQYVRNINHVGMEQYLIDKGASI